MPVRFTKFAFLRILLSHADELSSIVAAGERMIEAPTWQLKWAAFVELGDMLTPIIDEIVSEFGSNGPELVFGAAGDVGSLEAEFNAGKFGFDWKKLIDMLPALMAALKLILDQFTTVKVELEDAA